MKYTNDLFKQFLALQTRERVLAIAAFIGVLYFLFDLTILGPQRRQVRELQAQLSQQEAERMSLKQASAAFGLSSNSDPLAQLRAERDNLKANYAQAQTLLAHALSSDVRLGDVVRASAGGRTGLTLIGLRTLPSEIVFMPPAAAPRVTPPAAASSAAAPKAAAPDVAIPPLYRHGIEVTVQGSYPQLVNYMRDLERNAKGVFWGDARLTVIAYPEATLKITIHTLSSRPELPLG